MSDAASSTPPGPPGASRSALALLLLVSTVLVAFNLPKPVHIDDAYYLMFAEHAASVPGDPYGMSVNWFDHWVPAYEVLCPPVLPYWIALCMSIVGHHVVVLKLAMLPFAFLLTACIWCLLRRNAPPGNDTVILVLTSIVVLSPTIVPDFNLMLDVPSAALSLASVTVFMHACDRRKAVWAVTAGVLAALAIQTKYNCSIVVPVLFCAGLCRQQIGFGLLAGLVGVAVAGAWEVFVFHLYGHSEFLIMAQGIPLRELYSRRLLTFLIQLTGGLSPGVLGLCSLSLGSTPLVAGLPLVALLGAGNPASAYWSYALCGVITILLLLFSLVRHRRLVRDPNVSFLVLWIMLEIAEFLNSTAVTFPAARRVLPLEVVGTLLAATLLLRQAKTIRRDSLYAVLALVLLASGFIQYVDTSVARTQRLEFERVQEFLQTQKPAPIHVYFTDHWEFQYYASRSGWISFDDRRPLSPGDYLVTDQLQGMPPGFKRRGIVSVSTELPWSTVPNYYAGVSPVLRTGPIAWTKGVYEVVTSPAAR